MPADGRVCYIRRVVRASARQTWSERRSNGVLKARRRAVHLARETAEGPTQLERQLESLPWTQLERPVQVSRSHSP